MKKFVRVFLLSAFVVAFSSISPIASAETSIAGKLPAGFVFEKAKSPYKVTDTLLIEDDNVVRVEPGVTILLPRNKPLFWSLGSIELVGTESEKIQLIGNKGSLMKVTNAPRGISLTAQHVIFDSVGGIFSDMPANTDSIQVSISDSDFYKTLIDSWYPSTFLLERNVFLDGSGVMLGYSFDPSGEKSQPAVIRNNLFSGTPGASSIYGTSGSKMWINVWAAYGGDVVVTGNTFTRSKFIALNASVDGTINGSQNFWETINPAEIQKRVLDKADSFDWKNFINVASPLTNPDPMTPTRARFLVPIKYKDCSAMNKIYKGGVVKSSKWANKGSRLRNKPTVEARVFDLNKGLDRDKDGLVCER